MNKNLILTFGYGNRTNYIDLEDAISQHKVSILIDVRKKPRGWSAKWSAKSLSAFCESIGIDYLPQTALGNDSGKSNWIPPDKDKAEAALSEVSNISKQKNVLLLCAEKDWKRCHRVDVSEEIRSRTGNKVLHIS
jgi:uncharacterized protein (DUF488 family)